MASKPRSAAQWDTLKPATRRRYERTVGRDAYLSGASLSAARGHARTPERPERAARNPTRYGSYLQKHPEAAQTRSYVTEARSHGIERVWHGWDDLTAGKKRRLAQGYMDSFMKHGPANYDDVELRINTIAFVEELYADDELENGMDDEAWKAYRENYNATT